MTAHILKHDVSGSHLLLIGVLQGELRQIYRSPLGLALKPEALMLSQGVKPLQPCMLCPSACTAHRLQDYWPALSLQDVLDTAGRLSTIITILDAWTVHMEVTVFGQGLRVRNRGLW